MGEGTASNGRRRPSPAAIRWWLVYSAGALLLLLVFYLAVSERLAPWPVLGLVLALLLAWGLGLRLLASGDAKGLEYWREIVPCFLSVQDRHLRIVQTNALFDQRFGRRRGQQCYQVYKGRNSACPQCPVMKTFADGKVHTAQEQLSTPDGRRLEVVVTSAPLRGARGQVERVVEMFTDISEMEKLRQELARTRRDYKRLFDAVPCYICLLDRELRVVDANELYRENFPDPEGRFCFVACKKRTTPCPECLVQETFADGRVHTSEEVLLTGAGARRNMVVYSRPIRDDAGRVAAVLEVFTDITEVKRLERQLALMGRAVAGMAHRIKNIVMGLEGGIFVVNTGMGSGDQEMIAEGWEMVQRNVGKVSTIMRDLLFCAKERRPKVQPGVNPHEVAAEVYRLFRDRLRNDAIELLLEKSGPEHQGNYDAEGLHNLLNNLVANAIDACRFDSQSETKQHRIIIRCQGREDGSTRFEVEDNGAGIPEDVSDKLFEEFFSTKGTEGTGIGLLVVRKIAEEHGGRVDFDSRPGRGTRFRVLIKPVADSRGLA